MNKKRNNKGFSLVELIVVIAVMAVLVVVLAPAYLRYVDKARVQKDESALSEVVQAIKIAASEEAVSDEIPVEDEDATVQPVVSVVIEPGTSISVSDKDGTDDADSKLLEEVVATVGEKIELTSSKYKELEEIIFTVYQDSNHNLVIESEQVTLD